MFEIKGKIGDKVYKLGFRFNLDKNGEETNDYIISGDDPAIEKLFNKAKVNHGGLGPVPAEVSFKEGYLHGELSTYCLASSYVFDEVLESKNDWEPFDTEAVY